MINHGFGKDILLDKAYYEGQYKDGLKHGKGILNFADGSTYEGDFFMNDIHGVGVYK